MRINVIYCDVYHMLTLSKTYYNVISLVFDFFFAHSFVRWHSLNSSYIIKLSALSLLFLSFGFVSLRVLRTAYFTCIQHSFTNHLLAPINVTEGNQSFGQCTLTQ